MYCVTVSHSVLYCALHGKVPLLYFTVGTQATVQQSYFAKEDDELDLKEGDVVQVLVKGENGQWRGVKGARTGCFPGTCVKEMEQSFLRSESKGMYLLFVWSKKSPLFGDVDALNILTV